MNCLEFRRFELADPRALPTDAQRHRLACAACGKFAAAIDQQELALAQVLNVPAPEGLTERILLTRKTGRRFAPRLLALAASLTLAVGIGLFYWRGATAPRMDYARFAIEHVMHEPESFTTHVTVDPSRFEQEIAKFGGELQAPLGKVRYLRICPTPEGPGLHVVIDTPNGTATLIIIPSVKRGSRTLHATLDGWNATAGRAGEGYYALVTDSPRTLMEVDALLKKNMRWVG